MKRATAYFRNGKIFINSSSQATTGMWVASDPFVKIESISDTSVINNSIVDALAKSKSGVQHPTDFGALVSPILELAGVKKWSSFAKGVKCCEISEENGRYSFLPTKNIGRNGFEHLNEWVIEETNTEILARQLLNAFDVSTD